MTLSRKYAVLLSPLVGIAIGLAGGALAIAFLQLIGRNIYPAQQEMVLLVFGIGGFVLAVVELVRLWNIKKASERAARGRDA